MMKFDLVIEDSNQSNSCLKTNLVFGLLVIHGKKWIDCTLTRVVTFDNKKS